MATLRERARLAHETGLALVRHLERARRAAEMQRRREELVRLMRRVLGVEVQLEDIHPPTMTLTTRSGLSGVDGQSDADIASVVAPAVQRTAARSLDPELWLRLDLWVEEDGLRFRVAEAQRGGYALQVALICPDCRDLVWEPITSLEVLGRVLNRAESGVFWKDCSTCLESQLMDSDPFADE